MNKEINANWIEYIKLGYPHALRMNRHTIPGTIIIFPEYPHFISFSSSQVDVIEAQFSHLIHRLHSDQEIQLIQIAHEAYLAGLQAQALLFMPNIKLCILQLLNYCCQFVDLSNQQYYNDHLMNMDDDHNHQLSNEVHEMVNKFYNQAKLLYDLLNISCLTGAKSSVGFNPGHTAVNDRRDFESLSLPGIITTATTNGPLYSDKTDLNQLLLRLDFNHFYSDSLENLI